MNTKNNMTNLNLKTIVEKIIFASKWMLIPFYLKLF